ncbi:MAG TPA: hypothetical protein VH394_28970 [Thermoanaerobaculia bacterium]|nr:hypothetical protein [Thermoanaerobaculia bacterium]
MRKPLFRALLGFVFLAIASSASAQVWTAVASSGAIEDNSAATYGTSNGALFFRSGATGNVNAIYNVTDPKDSGSPSWTTLEFVAKTGGGLGVFATASLYRQPRFSGTAIAICSALAPATGALSTSTCTFSSSTFDFANNYYFVRVSLGRTSTAQSQTAWGVQIY